MTIAQKNTLNAHIQGHASTVKAHEEAELARDKALQDRNDAWNRLQDFMDSIQPSDAPSPKRAYHRKPKDAQPSLSGLPDESGVGE